MPNGRKGFEIGFDITWKILRVRIWGDWDAEFTQKFGQTLQERLQTICHDGQDYAMLIDGRDFDSETRGGLKIIQQYISSPEHWNVKKIGYLKEQPEWCEICQGLPDSDKMTQYACFTDEEQALVWLLDLALSTHSEEKEEYAKSPCRGR